MLLQVTVYEEKEKQWKVYYCEGIKPLYVFHPNSEFLQDSWGKSTFTADTIELIGCKECSEPGVYKKLVNVGTIKPWDDSPDYNLVLSYLPFGEPL